MLLRALLLLLLLTGNSLAFPVHRRFHHPKSLQKMCRFSCGLFPRKNAHYFNHGGERGRERGRERSRIATNVCPAPDADSSLSRVSPSLLLLFLFAAPPSTALQRLGEQWFFSVIGSANAGLKDGQGTTAGFSSPVDVAFLPNGKALVADWGSFSVRTVDLETRTVTTTFTSTVSIGGPRAIGVHPSGDYAVFSTSGNLIVKLPLAPQSPENVTVIAGTGGQGLRDGSTNESQFNVPSGVAFVPGADAVLVCDAQNHAIRLVTVQGQVTTVAGAGLPSLHDGVGPLAGLNMPSMLAVSSWPSRSGGKATPFAVFTEVGSNSVRYLDLNTQTVTTLAGGTGSGARDGFGTSALFRSPTGIALTESTAGGASGEGVFYAIVADTGNGYVRMVTVQYPGGTASKVMTLGLNDRQSYPEGPRGVALQPPDALVFSDTRGNRIRHGTVSCADGSYRYGYTCQPCTAMSEECPVGMQPVACTDSMDTYCGPCSGGIPLGAAFYNGTEACSWKCTGSLMKASEGDLECTPDWFAAGLILGGSCAFGIACIGAVFAVERSSIKAKRRMVEEMLAREAAEGGQDGHRPSVQISVAGSFKQKQTPAQRRLSSLLPPPSFEPGSGNTFRYPSQQCLISNVSSESSFLKSAAALLMLCLSAETLDMRVEIHKKYDA